jgi:regulator of protease activity HflC (stomatin/prohibitin superfamily)
MLIRQKKGKENESDITTPLLSDVDANINDTEETDASVNDNNNSTDMNPSAPVLSLSLSEEPEVKHETVEHEEVKQDDNIHSDKVTYLPPDYIRFEDISTTKDKPWIKTSDSRRNMLQWVFEHKQELPGWVRTPNADTDEQLVRAVNSNVSQTTGRSLGLGLATVFTGGIYTGAKTRNIRPGEIHFSENGSTQEIYINSGLHTLVNPRHAWGAKHTVNEDYIHEGNITIARIKPGFVGLATENGRPILLLPGRHAYNSALFEFKRDDTKNVNDPVIKHGTISIVRVLPHELGLATDNGNPIVLLAGVHIQNQAGFNLERTIDTRTLLDSERKEDKQGLKDKNWIEHGTISIAAISRNELGCAMVSQNPVLLLPGIHFKNSRSFKCAAIVDANKDHIHFNTIHVIQIKAGQVGLAWDRNKPIFLQPGRYEVSSNNFDYVGSKNANEKIIKHGPRTIVRVNQGEIGYAWEQGKALELKPGIYDKEDAQFIFDKHVPANQDVIQFGHITHIIVKAGEARAVWDDGKLQILHEGRHSFTSPTLQVAKDPIPLQDIVLPLKDIHVTTRDRMPMHVKGLVTYRVKDPEKLIKGIGQEQLKSSIEQKTDAELRYQVSLADLSMISPDHHSQHPGNEQDNLHEEKHDTPKLFGDRSQGGEGENYKATLCDNVKKELSETATAWGLEIVKFAISDIGFQDKKVEESLAAATADTRKAEAQVDLQLAQNTAAVKKAESDAKQVLIKKQNDAKVSQIEADAQAYKLVAQTKAEAESAAIRAQKEAEAKVAAQNVQSEAMVKQSEAKRDAAIAEAEGQKALAEAQLLLLNNPNYLALEQAKLQVEMARQLAQMHVPAMVFNSSESTPAQMFFGQGNSLVQFALQQQGLFRPAPVTTGTALTSQPTPENKQEKERKKENKMQ